MSALLRLCYSEERASSILETALVLPLLLYILAFGVDLGRAYFYLVGVQSAAEAGALYGMLNHSDTAGMIAAAKKDAVGVPSFSASASFGCECAVGGQPIPGCASTPATCAYNTIDYVEVTTSAVYTPMLVYPGVPSSYPFTARVNMRAAHF